MPHQCLKCGNLFSEGSTTILRGCPDCRGTRFFFTEEGLGADERKRLLAGSELTLREAIEDLVKKAKEGLVDSEEGDWIIAGPPPQPIIADPSIVPDDLPQPKFIVQGKKLIVKVPPKSRRLRRETRPARWDYVAPDPTPAPTAPPLFSTVGLKHPTPPEPPAAPLASPPEAPKPDAPTVTKPLESYSEGAVPAPVAIDVIPSSSPPAAPDPEPTPMGATEPETIRIHRPGHYEIDVKRLLEDSPVVIQRDGSYLIHLPSLFDSAGKGRR